MCNYCNRHKTDDKIYEYFDFGNDIELAREPYTVLSLGVDKNDNIVLVASGDYDAIYKPKFCPECGADLAYRKLKIQLSSLYGECASDE